MLFLNKFGSEIRNITLRQLKENARKEGIQIETESHKQMLRELGLKFAESYETMNLKVALFIMGLN